MMQTTYRINAQDINMAFVQSLRTLFGEQELEIQVKPTQDTKPTERRQNMLEWTANNRGNALKIDQSIDIRALIDQTHDSTL